MKKTERAWLVTCAGVTLLCISGAYAGDDRESIQTGAAEAAAGTRLLSGVYGISLQQSCIRTPFQTPPARGFDPVTHQLLVDGEIFNSHSIGLARFSRDGQIRIDNVVLSGLFVNRVSAGQTPVGTENFVCKGSQARAPDGKLTVSLSCDTADAPPGQTVTVAPLNFEGYVGEDRRSISLTTARSELHTVTVAVGGTAVQQREGICLQTMKLDALQ